MASTSENKPKGTKKPTDNPWAALTWDDLDEWAGGRSVSRGRTYQGQGRVKHLAVSDEGRLLATVVGGERYTTSVWLVPGKTGGEAIQSTCTCPVGYNGCKHAVAVVAEYLDLLAHNRQAPPAGADDPRWAKLSGEDSESDDDEEDEEDEEDEIENEEMEADAPPVGRRRARAARTDSDQQIRQHIEAKSRDELVELVWSLTQRFPELLEEFRERIALSRGDVDRLVKEARRELRRVTSEPGWRRHWSDEGYTPDYSRIKHRLERMVELGHHDAVMELGREIIECGLNQVGQSDDAGETASAMGECLPVIFKAVAASSLPAPQKVLFAIDAFLKDDYGIIGDEADQVMEADCRPEDWSAVAEELRRRLETKSASRGEDDFHGSYERDNISNWLTDALAKAGRDNEVLAIYEREARATHSYERLVKFLIDQKRYEDAERWATEGIEKTREKLPGIAAHLAEALSEVARLRKQWDVAAAHAAWQFFDQPGVEHLKQLLAAADKAGCQQRVREQALQFLETGVSPIRVATSRKGEHKAVVAPEWPLPVPGSLLPLFVSEGRVRSRSGPEYDVLIDLAIDEKRPDDVLRWYDKMRSERKQSAGQVWYGGSDYGDSVAAAVAESHPERALEIYAQRVKARLAEASPAAYETVAAYLRKMRPILKAVGRVQEWTQLLADIRLQYRNRPRFMEILDRLEDRTILQTQRRGR